MNKIDLKIMLNSGTIMPFFTTRRKIVQSIQELGYTIWLGSYQDAPKELCENFRVKCTKVPLTRAGLNPIKDIRTLYYYYKFMKEKKFDVVHSYTVKPNIYGSIAAKMAGIKRIYPTVNGLGYAFTKHDIKTRLLRRIMTWEYRVAFSCASKVFFQNVDDAEEMIQRKAVKREKCVVISGSGIDLNDFPFYEINDSVTFLLASRLLKTKGIRTYLEAAHIVKKNYPKARIALAGELDSANPDGISDNEIHSYTADGTIEYLGVIEKMAETLGQYSVFVLPSYYREGVPHAILEAMSAGRAILTTNSPGCKETVNGKNGFLIQPNDSADLARKMIWMIEHPKETKDMGTESRKYAEERFDVNIVNQMMISTMELCSQVERRKK